QSGVDQLAHAEAGPCHVVADQRQVAAPLPHQLIDQAMRAAHAHEAADHHASTVGRDAGHRFGRRHGSLLHQKSSSAGSFTRAADSRLAMACAAGWSRASSAVSVASISRATAFAVAPPSRTVLRPTKSLAWIAVVPS